jgi:hypothetical protein
MRSISSAVFLLLMTSPGWSEAPRRTVPTARIARPAGRLSRSQAVHPRVAAGNANAAQQLPQAPGVIQMNLLDESHIAWFVTAAPLSKGTQILPFIIFPDGTQMPLVGSELTDDAPAGSSFDLPWIRNLSQFWPTGFLTYGVLVNSGNGDMQAAADFPVGFARNYDDLALFVPRVVSTSESVASNGDVILSIRGVFSSGFPYVLFDDRVAPSSAIRLTASEIQVNLSQVPSLDLSGLADILLTVGQDGWSDTAIFRHTPFRPGSYNPAPN